MKERKTMKGQKGQALILVLGLLALGALIIVPALSYTATAQLSRRVSRDAITQQYAGDSAVQDALSQLLGLLNTLGPGNPSYDYNLTFDFGTVPVRIEVPTVPSSRNYGSGNIHNLFFEVDPRWLMPGDSSTKSYFMLVDTQRWVALTSFGFTLPKGLTHSSSSTYYWGPKGQSAIDLDLTPDLMYWNWQNQLNLVTHQVKAKSGWQAMTGNAYIEVTDGAYPPGHPQPNTSYLLITNLADGRQKLEWRPYLTNSGRSIFIQASTVTGDAGWGIHYISAWFYGTANIDIAQTAAVGVAIYNIKMTIGGVQYQVVVAYDSATGTFKIVSYQMVG